MNSPQTPGAAKAPLPDGILYVTGITPCGTPLIGGVWTLRDQEGFPLEMSHLAARDKGWAVDWMEAMADASRTNNCPALIKAVEAFLPQATVAHLKAGFLWLAQSGKSFDQVLAEKRENGNRFTTFSRQ